MEIWTLGYVKDIHLSEDHIILQYNGCEIKVVTSMLDPIAYQKGTLFTCLAHLEKDKSLLAKVLRNSDGMNPDIFIKCVSM